MSTLHRPLGKLAKSQTIEERGYAEPDDVRDFLLERIPGTQLLWCDVSPTQPIIAIASSEGLVFVVDVRDGRSVQTIDLWMGAGNTPHGLAFLRDGALAVLLADGLVVFMVSSRRRRLDWRLLG